MTASSIHSLTGHSVPLTPEDRGEYIDDVFLTGTLVLDPIDDVESLEFSLKDLMRKPGWNKLAARVQYGKNHILEHVFTAETVSNPINFSVSRLNGQLSKHPLGRDILHPTEDVSFQPPLNRFVPLFTNPNTCFTLADLFTRGDYPPCSAHLTLFEDCTLVGFTIPHILGDLSTLSIIMRAWLVGIPDAPIWEENGKSPLDVTDSVPYNGELICGYRRLKGFKGRRVLMSWIGDLVRTGGKKEEERCIYVPPKLIGRLRKEAEEQLDPAKGEWVSNHDLVVAWTLKLLYPALQKYTARGNRPFTIINHFNARRWGGELFKDVTYLGNAICRLKTSHPWHQLGELSIPRLALLIRGGLLQYGNQQEVERFISMMRKVQSTTTDMTSLMPSIQFTSWVSGELGTLTEGTRFGGAVMHHGSKGFKPGRYLDVIMGRDREGGFWVDLVKTPKQWKAIDKDVKKVM
ncbi:hypothetical protein T439DRAFT_380686 [Meredithblackwellia eburnea MCA 4105]